MNYYQAVEIRRKQLTGIHVDQRKLHDAIETLKAGAPPEVALRYRRAYEVGRLARERGFDMAQRPASTPALALISAARQGEEASVELAMQGIARLQFDLVRVVAVDFYREEA